MNPLLRPVFLCCWLLILVTFSAPGRDGPSEAGGLDFIALAKVGVRGLSVLLLGYVVLSAPAAPRRRVVAVFLPWGLYIGWAIVSVLWSALPAVTLGQSLGLIDLVLVAMACAASWRGPEDTEAILLHLTLALLAFSTIVLGVDVVRPDISGLDREHSEYELASQGIVHPTAAGATASLGLVLVLGCWLLWDWRWTRLLLVPGSLIQGVVMLRANSRMAIGMAALSLLLIVIGFTPRRFLAILALLVGLFGPAYLAVDPGMELVETAYRDGTKFLKRGESEETINSLTGRTDLWDAIWVSWNESPLIGHGYFVTSKTGLLDVWSGPANRTAHNIFLQVLVTTGIVGMALWAWAVLQAGGNIVTGLLSDTVEAGERRRLGSLLAVMVVWYVGWAQLAESFMGGVLPESVLFFALLGLGLGPHAFSQAWVQPPAKGTLPAGEVPA